MNQGLVVHPTALYAPLRNGAETAWVSAATAQEWADRFGATVGDERVAGSHWVGRPYTSPWSTGRVVDHHDVLAGQGTGVLHAVSGLAELDTELGSRHGWPLCNHLSEDGHARHPDNETLNGLSLPKATEKVIEALACPPWGFTHHTPPINRIAGVTGSPW